MKPLSLEECIAIENNTITHSDVSGEKLATFLRLLHTAREYHRLREALVVCSDMITDCDWECGRCTYDPHMQETDLAHVIREALKESEGE